jgi:rubrerythrin
MADPAVRSTRRILEEALDDERKAEATYEAVIGRFGPVRPFVNIVEAERRHQTALLNLFRRRNWPEPVNRWKGNVEPPPTLREACEAAIKGEEENIALYDRLLPSVVDEDAKRVLMSLQEASRERHLPAFRHCRARS